LLHVSGVAAGVFSDDQSNAAAQESASKSAKEAGASNAAAYASASTTAKEARRQHLMTPKTLHLLLITPKTLDTDLHSAGVSRTNRQTNRLRLPHPPSFFFSRELPSLLRPSRSYTLCSSENIKHSECLN
jgi:hypothetical protein